VVEITPWLHDDCQEMPPHRCHTYRYKNSHCRLHSGTRKACREYEKRMPSKAAYGTGGGGSDPCPKCEAAKAAKRRAKIVCLLSVHFLPWAKLLTKMFRCDPMKQLEGIIDIQMSQIADMIGIGDINDGVTST
jgi:hypothetical protein